MHLLGKGFRSNEIDDVPASKGIRNLGLLWMFVTKQNKDESGLINSFLP